jgi:RNA polymerase sigma factor (sigma-70 family)
MENALRKGELPAIQQAGAGARARMIRKVTEEKDGLVGEAMEYYGACFQWACRCCRGDVSEAREVLGEVYLWFLDGGFKTFQKKSSLKTFLFGVIKKKANNFFRRLARGLRRSLGDLSLEELPDVKIPNPEAQVLAEEEQKITEEVNRQVRHLIEQLPPRWAEVLHLLYFEYLTVPEIAAVMQCTEENVRKLHQRARDRLRALCLQDGLR